MIFRSCRNDWEWTVFVRQHNQQHSHVGCTSSHANTEVKQGGAKTVLGWRTAWEPPVLMIRVRKSVLLRGKWRVYNPPFPLLFYMLMTVAIVGVRLMKPIGTKNEFTVGGCRCPSQVELLQAVQPTPVGDKTQNPKCFFFIIDWTFFNTCALKNNFPIFFLLSWLNSTKKNNNNNHKPIWYISMKLIKNKNIYR